MKKKYLLFIATFGVLVASCHDLALEPKGQLGEAELFGNESGVKTYFTRLYNLLPIEDFNFASNGDHNDAAGYRQNNYWDAAAKNSLGNMTGELINQWTQVNTNGTNYWSYAQIRDVNAFIESFPKYKDNFPEATYNSILGEAYFLRANYYFGMAKRYGGIPLVKEVQNPYGDMETLKLPRATEYDTWKFIHDDLQFAIDNMGANSEKGRANKYAAAALMSRTMLYAGTIAKYSQYLGFAGEAAYDQKLSGIDADKANEFFQYSYDAGKLIDVSGKYALYTAKYPDKATNYAYIFQDENSSENIFIKDYDKDAPFNTRLKHSYDAMTSPNPDMTSDGAPQGYPSYDFMKLFDFPAITEADGTPKRWDKRDDFKADIEPRLRGIAYFDGDELRGATFDIQRGLYKTFTGSGLYENIQDGSKEGPINKDDNRIVAEGDGDRDKTFTYDGEALRIAGKHGLYGGSGGENNCITGAFVRKYVNESMPKEDVRLYNSGQPWIVFRLGEIYVNMAEAAYELGKKEEAFDYIEKIRERAGCKVTRPVDNTNNVQADYGYVYPIDGNLKFIRDERYRELAFENHRWWDIRRWRTATEDLKDWRPRVLMAYKVLDEGKYIYLDERNTADRVWNAAPNVYYQAIPQGEINKNNNLLPQNPLR